MKQLAGKVALVSGASRGIGQGIVLELAKAGCDVAICDVAHLDLAEQTAQQARQMGVRAIVIPCDVADQQAVERAVSLVATDLGKLDIAVANAAFSERQPFYEADMAGFRRTIDVTMWGAFHLTRAAVQQMLRQDQRGSVVVISSPHAHVPVPRSMAYNMAKAAIDQMARTAAIELAEHRIRVNIIHPGWIDTPGERKFTGDEQIRQAASKLPWGRLGQPEEIGRGVVFLCDPASDYITGSTLAIDGGITLPWWANRGSAVPE